MRTSRGRFRFATAALLGLLLPMLPPGAGPARGAEKGAVLQAIIEARDVRFHTGEPIEIRFSIWNEGDRTAGSLPKHPLTGYFEMTDSTGEKVGRTGGLEIDAPDPQTLPPGGHYGLAFDLGELYPRARLGGTFRLVWKAGELVSNEIVILVTPAYDPKVTYRATLDTTAGPFVLEFFPDKAPLAVKNFIELAYSGFYDGTRFHYVDPGRMIAGGDRGGDGSGTPGYTYPMENNKLEMLAGTVMMKNAGFPPTNGSVFFVLAAPRPDLVGKYTVFAQVVEGLDVVQKISRMPSTGPQARPANRPLKDVLIRKVTITEEAPPQP